MIDLDRLRAAYEKVRDELLAERTPDGHWVGELSSSALSTATAVSALAVVVSNIRGPRSGVQGPRSGVQGPRSKVQGRADEGSGTPTLDFGPGTLDLGRCTLDDLDRLISRGVAWLAAQQNPDGGFGDTDLSHSNIATTYLVVAALHLAGVENGFTELLARANSYLDDQGRLQGLRERYGIDKTFVVPIMTNLALAGLVNWREVDPLPFELACVPQSWYRLVGMPVVSYAIPALVAIGQAQFFHAPPRNPCTRLIRRMSLGRSARVLRRMQPDSGGYLEATPLTSFVVMSLASCSPLAPRAENDSSDASKSRSGVSSSVRSRSERTTYQVVRAGVKFLVHSVRPDGSWPIDTNLATWNTTLAINALAGAGEGVADLLGAKCLNWLLSCQHLKRHAFTGASPGGFGWSDLAGAVPDADDTPGALLALQAFQSEFNSETSRKIRAATEEGTHWLLGLQNRDGGWPTFCRGWGKLPFDRSGADLTAHAIRALLAVRPFVSGASITGRDHDAWDAALDRGWQFLRRRQHADGSWSPLWFGNQDRPDEDNPVYGTAKVLLAYRDLGQVDSADAQRAVAWLVANQNDDGGWGSAVGVRLPSADCRLRNAADANGGNNTGSSIEETALAVEALLAACPSPHSPVPSPLSRGLAWLIERVEQGQHRPPAPIGFYFAKLWYYERLYPLIFATAALGRACLLYAPANHQQMAPSDAP